MQLGDDGCVKCLVYHTRCRFRERQGGSLCFGGEQQGLNVFNPCVDEPLSPFFFISLKQLARTVTTTARDLQSNMIAVGGINPDTLKTLSCQTELG